MSMFVITMILNHGKNDIYFVVAVGFYRELGQTQKM